MASKKIIPLTVTMLLLTLFSQSIVYAQFYSNELIYVSPEAMSISFDTPFTVNVTNLQPFPVWVLCLAERNITRVDAPIFYTLEPYGAYLYQFISPNGTMGDFGGGTATYAIYIGAIDTEGTVFQTTEIILSITTVESLSFQLQLLSRQNTELLQQIMVLSEKANSNNTLVIAVVVSNVVWICIIIWMRLSSKKRDSVALTPQQPS